jgi:hypothetical protein
MPKTTQEQRDALRENAEGGMRLMLALLDDLEAAEKRIAAALEEFDEGCDENHPPELCNCVERRVRAILEGK